MDRVGSSIPFNAAIAGRSYGLPARPITVTPRSGPPPEALASFQARPTTQTEPIGVIRPATERRPGPTADPSRLVAAKVDPIDLARDVQAIEGRPTNGAFPMYRHPADRNQAAVGVELGRSLDIKG